MIYKAPFKDGLTSTILRDLIDEHEEKAGKQKKLFERYKGDVPITKRKVDKPAKVNNKLANDFFGDIVDTKVGYMGSDVTVELKKDRYEGKDKEFKKHNQLIQDHQQIDQFDDKISRLIRWAAIAGLGVKILYYDYVGDRVSPLSLIVNPWEVIFVSDGTLDEPQSVLHYYTIQHILGDHQIEERIHVQWYDKENVTYYVQDREGGPFYFDDSIEPNPVRHYFDDIPVIAYPNNSFELGDGDKIVELIDAYDRSLSDVSSEIEQLRLAYMYYKGVGGADLEDYKQTGILFMDTEDEAGFITKKLDDSIIEHHLDRLERNILRFGKSVDFGDEAFGGNMPVIAFQIKVAGLEHKCKMTERSFKKSLDKEYRLLTEAWKGLGYYASVPDPSDIYFTFTRDIPFSLKEELETLANARGHLSDKTLYSLMSFIKDPEAEMEQLKKEQKEREALIDLDKYEG
jgi:SPP1 family phage portal protein